MTGECEPHVFPLGWTRLLVSNASPVDPSEAFDDNTVDIVPESIDEAALERLQTIAYLLDSSVRVPGTRFRIGLDPILGVLPGAGDVLAGALSMYIVIESGRLGVSYTTLVRMLANVTVDTAVGAVPIVGDLLDAAWRSNQRNVRLARRDLARGSDGSARDTSRLETDAATGPDGT